MKDRKQQLRCKRLTTESPWSGTVQLNAQSSSEVYDSMSVVGMPAAPIRSLWMRWNQADLSMDRFRTSSELNYCQQLRREAEVVEDVEDTFLFWEKEKAIHLCIQLIASEQVKDEELKKCTVNLHMG